MSDEVHRIHIFGASGAGTTTLGAALAGMIAARHLDTDKYYWKKTDPPFQQKQPPEHRIKQIQYDVADHPRWILSGSICSWGDPLIKSFTLAVFLQLARTQRMQRLQAREQARYGERILPGGDMHQAHEEFMAWAHSYDDAAPPIRSLAMHKQWLQRLPCTVLHISSAQPVEQMVDAVLGHLQSAQTATGKEHE